MASQPMETARKTSAYTLCTRAALASSASAVGVALIDGNFNLVIRTIADAAGVPPVAASAMETMIAGDLVGGARALIPIATDALTPVLSDAISSAAVGVTLRAEKL